MVVSGRLTAEINVARTSVRLYPLRTEVRTTTATLEFISIKTK